MPSFYYYCEGCNSMALHNWALGIIKDCKCPPGYPEEKKKEEDKNDQA